MIRLSLTLTGVMVCTACAGVVKATDADGILDPVAVAAGTTLRGDAPATHNMLVVGEKTVYLSHLPMFQEPGGRPMPHRFQVILEVTFAGSDNPQLKYAMDRQSHPDTKVYTLNPEPFVLSSLIDPASRLERFRAKVFRGHLEKLRPEDGPIIRQTEVRVSRVLHFHEFTAVDQKPDRLEYLLFGKGDDLFLAHVITKAPDFDQVLKAKIDGQRPADDKLAEGIRVVFPGTVNSPASRLIVGRPATGEIAAATPEPIKIDPVSELYFEEGELRLPADFNQTPEEKNAGVP